MRYTSQQSANACEQSLCKQGLIQNKKEAVRLYGLAADQNNAQGQFSLGLAYRDGRGGLTRDDKEAFRLFALSADQGFAQAKALLEEMRKNGRDRRPPSPPAKWWRWW